MMLYENIINIIFGKNLYKKDLEKLHEAPKNNETFIFSLFDYKQNKTKQIIKYLKNNNDLSLKKEIAYMMSEYIIDYISDQQELLYFKNPIIIPVPISNKRLRKRGFNQTHTLAKYLAKKIKGIYNKNLIEKYKTTKKQALIKNRKERFENVHNIFSISKKKKYIIKNKDVIIVDDLVTTGATIFEIKKVLKKNGARNIIAITIAH